MLVNGGRAAYVADEGKRPLYWNVPIANTTSIFLGTGTSFGVPMIGCRCDVCLSDDSRDSRLRASVLLKVDGLNVLIDTTPDLRAQALRYGLDRVDAVLLTHHHADHIFGFDDLRGWQLQSTKAQEHNPHIHA